MPLPGPARLTRAGSWRAAGVAVLCCAALPGLSQSGTDTAAAAPTADIGPGPQIVDTLNPAVPGAEEFLLDTPSVLSWSRYQGGQLGDWEYLLFPDGSALVLEVPQGDERPDVAYRLRCRLAVSCQVLDASGVVETVPAIGAPKPTPPADANGRDLARFLGQWVLAGTGTPPPAPARPSPQPLAEPGPQESDGEDEGNAATGAETSEPAREEASRAAFPARTECLEPDPFHPEACIRRALPASGPATPPEGIPARPRTASPAPAAPTGDETAAAAEPSGPVEDDRKPTLAERALNACSVTGGATLRYTDHETSETEYGKMRISLGCYVQATDRLSLRFSLVQYPVQGQQAPWDPDYTFAFNYRVNDVLSLSLSSYTARFSGEGSDVLSSIQDGGLRASIRLPEIPLGDTRKLSCSVGISLLNLPDSAGSLTCGMAATPRLRLSLITYFYPPGAQEPWSPDYAYTASYRINDRWSVNYSNYANNRWPWNRSEGSAAGPLGASVSVTYRLGQ